MAKTLVTPEDQLGVLKSDLAQRDAQIAVLEQRTRELAGFQSEAVAGRDAIAKLQSQLDQASARADAADRGAKLAGADAKSTAALRSGDADLLKHAKSLAVAVKGLLA